MIILLGYLAPTEAIDIDGDLIVAGGWLVWPETISVMFITIKSLLNQYASLIGYVFGMVVTHTHTHHIDIYGYLIIFISKNLNLNSYCPLVNKFYLSMYFFCLKIIKLFFRRNFYRISYRAARLIYLNVLGD
jgi:hypothetical protein